MKPILAMLIIFCALTGCGSNYSYDSENHVPEVRLAKAYDPHGGFHLKWNKPILNLRSVVIERQEYDTTSYKAWVHHGKPIDDAAIYLTKLGGPKHYLIEFQPGSIDTGDLFQRSGSSGISFVRILTVGETNQILLPTLGKRIFQRDHVSPYIVYSTTQNYRIGAPQVRVLESEELEQ